MVANEDRGGTSSDNKNGLTRDDSVPITASHINLGGTCLALSFFNATNEPTELANGGRGKVAHGLLVPWLLHFPSCIQWL